MNKWSLALSTRPTACVASRSGKTIIVGYGGSPNSPEIVVDQFVDGERMQSAKLAGIHPVEIRNCGECFQVLVRQSESNLGSIVFELQSSNLRVKRSFNVPRDAISVMCLGDEVLYRNSLKAFRGDGNQWTALNIAADPTLSLRDTLCSRKGCFAFRKRDNEILIMSDDSESRTIELPNECKAIEPSIVGETFAVVCKQRNGIAVMVVNDQGGKFVTPTFEIDLEAWDVRSFMCNANLGYLVSFVQSKTPLREGLFVRFDNYKWTVEDLSGLKNFVVFPRNGNGEVALRQSLMEGIAEIWTLEVQD